MSGVEVDTKRYAENPKEALLRAADLLDEVGWTQLTSLERGRRCLSSALSCVIGVYDAAVFGAEPTGLQTLRFRRSQLWAMTGELLSAELGHPDFVAWNDEPGRTKEEVTGLLRRVASKL